MEEVGRVRHLLQLRERLGLDTNPNPTTKSEKDVCNLAARASLSPVHHSIPPSPQTPEAHIAIQAEVTDCEYTQSENELLMKCIHLIQGRLTKEKTVSPDENGTSTTHNKLGVDASPADEGCDDMNVSYMSGNSIELCSPDRVDMPNGWEAPAPATQPTLQPLRLYVPELEEIRVSPVVARKGYLNVLEHGGSGWKKRWVVINN